MSNVSKNVSNSFLTGGLKGVKLRGRMVNRATTKTPALSWKQATAQLVARRKLLFRVIALKPSARYDDIRRDWTDVQPVGKSWLIGYRVTPKKQFGMQIPIDDWPILDALYEAHRALDKLLKLHLEIKNLDSNFPFDFRDLRREEKKRFE